MLPGQMQVAFNIHGVCAAHGGADRLRICFAHLLLHPSSLSTYSVTSRNSSFVIGKLWVFQHQLAQPPQVLTCFCARSIFWRRLLHHQFVGNVVIPVDSPGQCLLTRLEFLRFSADVAGGFAHTAGLVVWCAGNVVFFWARVLQTAIKRLYAGQLSSRAGGFQSPKIPHGLLFWQVSVASFKTRNCKMRPFLAVFHHAVPSR